MSEPPTPERPPALRFEPRRARPPEPDRSPRPGAPPPARARASSRALRPRSRPPRHTRLRPPQLPLWLRWALSLSIAAVAIVLLVRYVNGHTADTPTFASPQAQVTANREATILIEQDQAPRTAALPQGVAPPAALRAAVSADMNRLIAHNEIYGPLKSVSCHPTGPAGPRQTFRCDALANGVYYPFLAVVDTATARITYCKSDPPPIPSMRIPVSRRCR